MSARFPEPCDGLRGEHAGSVRFYRTGWKCSAHSPWAEAGQEEPKPGPGLPGGARASASGKRRPNPAAQVAVGRRPDPAPDLRVDLGQRDAKNHRWIRYPTADYVCPACHETESASGDQVAHFAAHIETEHQQRCTANTKDGDALPGAAASRPTESSNS